MKSVSLTVRLTARMKSTIEKQAKKAGCTPASYVERVLELHHAFPIWLFRDVQPHNHERLGSRVTFLTAEGWPDASIEAYQAERFGEQLIEAARRAKDLPKAKA